VRGSFTVEYMTTEECILMETYDTPTYNISYFGGEPLLNWGVLKYSHEKYFKNDSKCNYEVIITNGLELTEEKVNYIQKEHLGVSLSFDGIWQKTNRPLHGGKDSFKEYMNKKELIHKLCNGCKVMVAPDNIKTMTENFEFFVDDYNFLTPDFSLVRDDIWLKDDVELFKKESERLRKKTEDYLSYGKFAVPGFYLLWILDEVFGKIYGKRSFGCFAGNRGCGYSPDGIFYPCARFATNKMYPLIDTNDGKIYHENINKLYTPKVYNPQEYNKCKVCELYQTCNAGCLFSELYTKEDKVLAKPVSRLCDIYKIIEKDSKILLTKFSPQFKQYVKNFMNNGSKK